MSPRNSCLAVKMGGAIPFDGESFCAELGPLSEQDRAKASTACPTCGLTANSTTSGVLKDRLLAGCRFVVPVQRAAANSRIRRHYHVQGDFLVGIDLYSPGGSRGQVAAA
jgi:hypothetical protein